MTRAAAFLFSLVMLPVLLAGCAAEMSDDKKPEEPKPITKGSVVTVAVSLDIPPYVIGKASGGMHIDILQAALPDYRLKFVQLPFGDLATAVQEGKADVAAAVRRKGDGVQDKVFYSAEFARFADVAITKESDLRPIATVADLSGARVLTWEGADVDLGSPFLDMFGIGGPDRAGYVELADQADQVRTFWRQDGYVAIIDSAIFRYFSLQLGHDRREWLTYPIFPPVTGYKVAFRDAMLRDIFNEGLAAVCKDGRYAAFLMRYGAEAAQSVCW